MKYQVENDVCVRIRSLFL